MDLKDNVMVKQNSTSQEEALFGFLTNEIGLQCKKRFGPITDQLRL